MSIVHSVITFLLMGAAFWPASAGAVPEDLTLTWPGGATGTVVFDGTVHAKKGLTCDICHLSLFQTKKGGDIMTMSAIKRGKFCGECHNGVRAFSAADPAKCRTCHRGSPKRP